MFDIDTFVSDCLSATAEDEPRQAVKAVLARTVSEPAAVARALPAERAGIERLHVSAELTVIKVVWGPSMRIYPHDHRMWAAIGIYTGQEDNAFYRRTPEGVVPSGGTELRERDAVLLGADAIHSVVNPRQQHTGAIHVYGGDFFTQPRSEFDPETLEEGPYQIERTLALFDS